MLIEALGRPVVIQWEHVTNEEYVQLCVDNPHLRIERTAEGDIIVRRAQQRAKRGRIKSG
jgi:Uma2 family endonuclease